jgi:hypothetical protein
LGPVFAGSACKKAEKPASPSGSARAEPAAPAPPTAPPPAPGPAQPKNAPAARPAIPLKDGAFAAGEGFRIEKVPAGVSFHSIDGDDDPPTWEVRDNAGKRLAVIVEEPWNHVGSPAVGPSKTKVAGLDSSRHEENVKDFGGGPARVVEDHFETDSNIYRIQRRVGAAEWIVDNWKIVSSSSPRLDLGPKRPSMLKLDLDKK